MVQQCEVDLSSVIDRLRNFGFIEEIDPSVPIVPPRLMNGEDDRVTWLGHASMLFQTSRSSVCVDPFLRPHIQWTEQERQSSFSHLFADRWFFEPYGPDVTQLSPAQLPHMDAVFVTHQDIDHCNVGVLMMLPEDVPIIVPDYHPHHSWEVDLQTFIKKVLGTRRKVIRLKHGETMTIGDIRATAFPFYGEMPSSLKTLWNCYLFETDKATVACTADSAVTDETVDFLVRRLGSQRRPFVLCARLIHSGESSPGFRDETNTLFNFTRLWAWHMPIWDLFQPVEEPGISEAYLRLLAQRTNLRFYLPYAMGTAPWFRITDPRDPLHMPMANMSADDLSLMKEKLAALAPTVALFPGKFAVPFNVSEG
jgi:L-ascorbate metabolism protein UlaG (beta-lactamase superfamily)